MGAFDGMPIACWAIVLNLLNNFWHRVGQFLVTSNMMPVVVVDRLQCID